MNYKMASTKEIKKMLNEMLIVEWQDTIDMMKFNINRYVEEINLFNYSDDPADQRVVNSRKRMIELCTKNIELAEFKINELKKELQDICGYPDKDISCKKKITADLKIVIDDKLIERLKNNTDCKIKVEAACIGKTKVTAEILES